MIWKALNSPFSQYSRPKIDKVFDSFKIYDILVTVISEDEICLLRSILSQKMYRIYFKPLFSLPRTYREAREYIKTNVKNEFYK